MLCQGSDTGNSSEERLLLPGSGPLRAWITTGDTFKWKEASWRQARQRASGRASVTAALVPHVVASFHGQPCAAKNLNRALVTATLTL
eukprot:1161969-Pelagomonas_calceolata.AAC.11